jgi:hypothetical protein
MTSIHSRQTSWNSPREYIEKREAARFPPSINQLLRSSFQSLEVRNDVLTIFGVRNGNEHLRAVNVACRVLQPLIESLLIPRDVCRLEGS